MSKKGTKIKESLRKFLILFRQDLFTGDFSGPLLCPLYGEILPMGNGFPVNHVFNNFKQNIEFCLELLDDLE